MHLQNILLTDESTEKSELYLKSDHSSVSIVNDELNVSSGKNVSFDTYFNSIHAGKWAHFTGYSTFTLNLSIIGTGVISLYERDGKNSERLVIEESFSDSEIKLEFSPSNKLSQFFFNIKAESDITVKQGAYSAEPKAIRDVRLAVVICTFKREEYVYKNLLQLKNYFNKNGIGLKNFIDILVIDNGQSLENAGYPENITIIPNRNTGGAGGFTRGIIESLHSEKDYTHVLLMDDDIEICLESIYRTFTLLSIIKSEFYERCISGAMFRLETKNIQYENNAIWNGMLLNPMFQNIDMSEYENVFENGNAYFNDRNVYSGWWYFCIPIEIIKKNNLPFPYFVRRDDVEYSLRIANQPITMNGICVWHPPFDQKRNDVFSMYLDTRNDLILISLRNSYFIAAIKSLLYLLIKYYVSVVRYEYDKFVLPLTAFKDFYKTSDLFKGDPMRFIRNASQLNKETEKNTNNISEDELKNKIAELPDENHGIIKRIFAIITLNGNIIPFLVYGKTTKLLGRGRGFYRWFLKRELNIISPNEKVIIHKRLSFRKFLKTTFQFIIASIVLLFKFPASYFYYRKNFKYLTSEEFWYEYLEIKK
jgi:galactofuranosylgalactofuranosylrhamnosyl-N-acetylglucosaminyl-diphospho-decaprenol beta-1,5/1,6-galactofuranosyltransferase